VQIKNIPENLIKFYPSDYYSYSFPQKSANQFIGLFNRAIKRNLVKYYAGKFNLMGFLFSSFFENPFPWLKKDICNFNSRILDVGSGAGRLLLSLQRSGFKSLTGIDPFIEKDINYKNGVLVLKKNIFKLEGEFDLIMLHHSFEHMDFPLEILQKLRTLLSNNGTIIIRIPVTGGFAWRKYNESWVQLDAPRHFFLHSIQSMQMLCKSANLQISNTEYDSSTFQFTGSEKYLRGFSLFSEEYSFTKKQISDFQKETNQLNKINDGDAACFYIRKI
jgi:2-polyprenyl-3-methyl-5-hydroxy-6-metoxy-1,4-benzoquinol methylase